MQSNKSYRTNLRESLLETNTYDKKFDINHTNDYRKDKFIPGSRCKLITVLCINSVVFLAELITEFLTKSNTLESDSLNKLFNELSIIIGLVSYELSKKQISDKMSFGCERYESFSGLCNGVLLLSICLTNLCHSVQSFLNVSGIDHPFLFIIVGVVYFFINIFDIIILNDYKSSFILNGVFVHIMLDFFNSIAVIISACVVNYTNWKYKNYIYPAIVIIISIGLFFVSFSLIKKTSVILAEGVPNIINLNHVRQQLIQIPGIVFFHELHIWEISKNCYFASVHVIVSSKDQYLNILSSIYRLMRSYKIVSTTVQTEFCEDFPDISDNKKSCLYASSFGNDKRCFETPPVYKHVVGCKHINTTDNDESSSCSSHAHHHHHDHDDNNVPIP